MNGTEKRPEINPHICRNLTDAKRCDISLGKEQVFNEENSTNVYSEGEVKQEA